MPPSDARSLIVKAAAKCFARDGLRGTTTKAIGAEAKVSAGHMFHYFADKDEIIAAVAELQWQLYRRRFRYFIREPGGLARLLSLFGHPKDAHMPWPDDRIFFDLLGEARRNPKISKIVAAGTNEIKALLVHLFIVSRQRGEIRSDADPEVLASVMLMAIDGYRTARVRRIPNPAALRQLGQLLRRLLKVRQVP
jgi:AcrR family transcriptional regulator